MTKTKYSATLASGHTITRTSDRFYSHFWMARGRGATKGYSGGGSGFAASRELANKAAASMISRIREQGGADVQIVSEIVEAQINQ